MAKPKKLAGAQPIFDVAHPGKSAPAANSKSVILSNRPLLRDPMMVERTTPGTRKNVPAGNADQRADASPNDPLLELKKPDTIAKPSKLPTIAELAEAANADSQPLSPIVVDADPKTDDPEKPKEKTNNKPEPETPKDNEPEKEKPENDTDEKVLPTKEDNAKQEEAEATKEAEHQASIDKLADSKQYYLPINTVEKRRSRRFIALGIILSLLLAVAWIDIALDAGLIQLHGIKPLTHFFSN